MNFGTTGLLLQSWQGAIAVRLFISTKTKDEANKNFPFEYVSDEAYVYGTKWEDDDFDIKDDSRYFVFDDKHETFINANDILCRWKNSVDLNNDVLRYFVEISKSPRFDETSCPTLKYDNIRDSEKTYSVLQTKLENDVSYFFRIRAYDGIDYGDWSYVHGFTLTSIEKPIAEITSIEFLETDGKYNGDIKVNFKITDHK